MDDYPVLPLRLSWGSALVRLDYVTVDWKHGFGNWVYPPVPGQNGFIGTPTNGALRYTERWKQRSTKQSSTAPHFESTLLDGWLNDGCSVQPGSYRARIMALKPFGNPLVEAHWEVFLSETVLEFTPYWFPLRLPFSCIFWTRFVLVLSTIGHCDLFMSGSISFGIYPRPFGSSSSFFRLFYVIFFQHLLLFFFFCFCSTSMYPNITASSLGQVVKLVIVFSQPPNLGFLFGHFTTPSYYWTVGCQVVWFYLRQQPLIPIRTIWDFLSISCFNGYSFFFLLFFFNSSRGDTLLGIFHCHDTPLAFVLFCRFFLVILVILQWWFLWFRWFRCFGDVDDCGDFDDVGDFDVHAPARWWWLCWFCWNLVVLSFLRFLALRLILHLLFHFTPSLSSLTYYATTDFFTAQKHSF